MVSKITLFWANFFCKNQSKSTRHLTPLLHCFRVLSLRLFHPFPVDYQYDQLHRIKRAISKGTKNETNGTEKWQTTLGGQYKTEYDYDANGNITSLDRYYQNSLVDQITYTYNTTNINGVDKLVNNQLASITEPIGDQGHGDITDASTYTYDAIGNLVKDTEGQIYDINWTVTGKVKEVIFEAAATGKDDLAFTYDAGDNRLTKYVDNGNKEKYIYQRNASGNVLAVYNQRESTANGKTYRETYLMEAPIYGSRRLGQNNYGRPRLIKSVELLSNGNQALVAGVAYETKVERQSTIVIGRRKAI